MRGAKLVYSFGLGSSRSCCNARLPGGSRSISTILESFTTATTKPRRRVSLEIQSAPHKDGYSQLSCLRTHSSRSRHFPRKLVTLLAVIPLLSARADDKANEGRDKSDGSPTTELRMLAISEEETRENRAVPKDGALPLRILKYIRFYAREWIFEPIATGFRFVHLAIIFVPVILTIPVIWIGTRQLDKDQERSGTLWWYGFLIRSMERAGPAFIKLGQWAASRTDIFPTELCSMMSTLHSNVAAHPLAKTKEIVERAFNGRQFDTIFTEFDETPLGIGAIAQVYRAKLNKDLRPPSVTSGSSLLVRSTAEDLLHKVDALVKSSPPKVPSDWVAIKVLHPRVSRLVNRDLLIMRTFALILNVVPTLEWLSLPDEVDKFGEMMRLQLDLRIEANNLVKFRENFKNRNTVAFPIPYTEYTTREVLVEEFAHGIPLEAFLRCGAGVYQKEIADMGLDAFLHMLLIDNFAHADLHPGNIMVRFFKPTPIPILSQLHIPFITPPQVALPASSTVQEVSQITEEALSRLRPLQTRPKEWQSELSKLDAEGYRPQLIFIDTGLVTELSPVNRQNFLDLFTAVAEFDGYHAGELMVDRCRQPAAVIDRDVFCLRMQHLVLGVKGRTFTLGQIKIADILSEVLSMIRGHHVRLEGDFINVVLSILLLEGIGRQLDPKIDIFKSSLPILRQLGAQRGADKLTMRDISMLKVWVGLEIREFLTSSIQDVENCVKYDLLSPNI